ncbi:MAG: YraN family protein [Arachidicoccus sp.]|nr:YraN family protein [Arachidicoccus sp.]
MHNKTIGKDGEALAVNYFIQNGFTILHCNWRHGYIEIDIIAYKEKMLHFIEVKTRTGTAFGRPEEAVSKKKMDMLKRGAEEYQYKNPQWKYIQFDVLAVQILKDGSTEYWLNEDVYF